MCSQRNGLCCHGSQPSRSLPTESEFLDMKQVDKSFAWLPFFRLRLPALFVSTLVSTAVFAQDPDARARELVRQMTLEEKIQQLHGIRDDTHYRFVPPLP